ncbi:hypothetical protein LZC95_31135 [Pendulispora brunnea]|uniref:Uncharacterized protein n=1 Tax=Pendulispora brunnea TaxID=2905690 RepID=A0ABZ2JX13_9BACT
MKRLLRALGWPLVVASLSTSASCSRKNPAEKGRTMDATSLEVKTDIAKLGKYMSVPPAGVESVRWVAVPDPDQSTWVPPILYRFYVYYRINPAMWPEVEKTIGPAREHETMSIPTEVAAVLLESLADGLPHDGSRVRVEGPGYDTTWLGTSKSAAVRYRDGLLVTAPWQSD